MVLPTVVACEHKYDGQPPRFNCEYCWEAYFKTSQDLVAMHKELEEGGIPAMRAKYGTKLVRAFSRFLDNEVRQGLHERMNAIQEQEGGSEGASGEVGRTDDSGGKAEASGSPVEDAGQEEQHGELSDALGGASEQANPEHQDGSAVA